MPLVGDGTHGFMLKAVRRKRRQFEAKALSHVWIYLAKGFRVKREARALHIGRVSKARRQKVFYATRSFWLSLNR